jgi:hypothetical protein
MTLEQRLTDALRQLDAVEPSPDLFARVERSLAQDRAFRRRRLTVAASILAGLLAVVTWVVVSTETGVDGNLFIDSWKLVVASLAVSFAILVALAPHIRRFGRSFIDDVFHLSPETGAKFLVVLDIAYYTAFTGLILVDADLWHLGETRLLFAALGDFVFRLGNLLGVMGLLHAINIAFLPVLGLIYNSIVRADLRRRAGDAAPPESKRARVADRNARSFAIAIAVLALSLVATLLVGGPGALLVDGLD